MSGASPMERDTARLNAVAGVPVPVSVLPPEVQTDLGELLDLPAGLWPSIDEATAAAAEHPDDATISVAFAQAFAKALHRNGLVLVPRARSESRYVVSADTYANALAGKHHVERELHGFRQLLLGWPACPGILLEQAGEAVLAIAGRAPPEAKAGLEQAFLRLRALTAIAFRFADVSQAPAFIEPLAKLFMELRPATAEPSPPASPSTTGDVA